MSVQDKFSQLTEEQQKSVKRQVSELRQFGAQVFWMETGGHVETASFLDLVKFVMGW